MLQLLQNRPLMPGRIIVRWKQQNGTRLMVAVAAPVTMLVAQDRWRKYTPASRDDSLPGRSRKRCEPWIARCRVDNRGGPRRIRKGPDPTRPRSMSEYPKTPPMTRRRRPSLSLCWTERYFTTACAVVSRIFSVLSPVVTILLSPAKDRPARPKAAGMPAATAERSENVENEADWLKRQRLAAEEQFCLWAEFSGRSFRGSGLRSAGASRGQPV